MHSLRMDDKYHSARISARESARVVFMVMVEGVTSLLVPEVGSTPAAAALAKHFSCCSSLFDAAVQIRKRSNFGS